MPELPMRSNTVALALGGLLAVLLAVAGLYAFNAKGAWTAAPEPYALRPDDRQTVQVGARIYTQHCAACHGIRGEGQPNWREHRANGLLPAPPHDESGHTWHHPDAQLFAITKHGLAQLIRQPGYRTDMPRYDGVLSDTEIVAVLSWIKAQWPQETRVRHDQLNDQYRKSLER